MTFFSSIGGTASIIAPHRGNGQIQPNLNKNIKPNNFNNKKLKISSQKNIFNQDKPLYNALSYIQ